MLTFGSYFCFDMPSVLQNTFTAPLHPNSTGNCSTVDGKPIDKIHSNGTHCSSGLELTETQFNLLYAIYAWTNAIVVVLAGFLIDKLGNPIGALLFSSMCLAGTSVFAIGLYFNGESAMVPIFLLGRILFGSGNGSLTIVQNRISAMWFKGKELAFAFGCILAFSRLGSVLNFFLTEGFNEKYGLQWTLWGGAILCGVGVVCAVVVSLMDVIGLKQLNKKIEMEIESKRMRLMDIKHFSSSFWLLAFCLMFFYIGVFPFIANASKFIYVNYNETFRFTKQESSYIAGSVYMVSMLFGPLMGLFVCSIPHKGTALGLTTSIQMIGMGIANIIVGKMLDDIRSKYKWKYVMIFLLANTLACVTFAILVNIDDRRKGGVLNRSPRNRDNALIEGPANNYGSISTSGYTNKDALLYDSSTSIN
ncbi:Major facilitator superfamily domain-containing protein 1 [Stylophora pistillata]|uniref:Lysosomal dipeptide transporter MFSD1 n=1 Tax=Stylophora pistillata TaxID=50429 RepID=A0A2B4SAS2_STYPI|nr:Major facilitator superfamily domain-containing protein 1 [Stylophora pistillata]